MDMRYEHIRKSDLNLLTSLQTLVEERSITRAARRMFLSQPAMSRVFDRLQYIFRDELLVRSAAGYEPTPRAIQLYSALDSLLPKVEELLRGEAFDPSDTEGTFKLAATDHAVFVLIPTIMESIAKAAPRLQLEVTPWDDQVFRKLHTNVLDLAFWVNEAPQPLRTAPLFTDEFVCLLRKGHPASEQPLTLKRYLESRHVAISVAGSQQGLVERTLDRCGKRRDVQLIIPYYGSVGAVIERSDMIATMSKRLAQRFAAKSRTVAVPAPKEFASFTYIQVWHPRHDANPAHTWLREVVRKAAAT